MLTNIRQSIRSAATGVPKGAAAEKPCTPESCRSIRQAGCSGSRHAAPPHLLAPAHETRRDVHARMDRRACNRGAHPMTGPLESSMVTDLTTTNLFLGVIAAISLLE